MSPTDFGGAVTWEARVTRVTRVARVLGIVGTGARMAAIVSLSCASVLTADYVLQNTPGAARNRSAKLNADAVRVARGLYERHGCLTVDDRLGPARAYTLDHANCSCPSVADDAASARAASARAAIVVADE